MIAQHITLWNRIQAWSPDNPTVSFPFSKKLAKENNWSENFTDRAIEEYKRFLLLCCILPGGASPSPIVDTVWHLHLTYTQSYWDDLCKNVLQQPLHHAPSGGGVKEFQRHKDWYRKTHDAYVQTFNDAPPADIWPQPSDQRLPVADGTMTETIAFWPHKLAAAIILLLFFLYARFHQLNPYQLNGKQFLEYAFYVFVAMGTVVITALYKRSLVVADWIQQMFPEQYSLYQISHFIHGRYRALQIAIVDLVQTKTLVVEGDYFRYHKENLPNSDNPLSGKLSATPNRTSLHAKTIAENYYDETAYTHPALEKLEELKNDRVAWRRWPIALFLIGLILRVLQGIDHNKPVGYLLVMIIASLIIYAVIIDYFSNKNIVSRVAKKLYQNDLPQKMGRQPEDVLLAYDRDGIQALVSYTMFIGLATVLATYPAFGRTVSNDGGWADSGAGGSDSDGGSDSGGGDGGDCGGGCGGCGGGD